jgi:hypothetical protein
MKVEAQVPPIAFQELTNAQPPSLLGKCKESKNNEMGQVEAATPTDYRQDQV